MYSSLYAIYIIHTDGRETGMGMTPQRQEAIDKADCIIANRLSGTRAVVVRWNNVTERDELIHEVQA